MAYTAASLEDYMGVELGPLLSQLGLDTSDALAECVSEIAAMLGQSIPDVDDDLKLRTLARWQAWQAALNAAANQFDLRAGSVDLKLSQMYAQIERRYAQAEASASRYEEVAATLAGAGGVAYVTSVSTGSDPYAWPASEF